MLRRLSRRALKLVSQPEEMEVKTTDPCPQPPNSTRAMIEASPSIAPWVTYMDSQYNINSWSRALGFLMELHGHHKGLQRDVL